MCTRNAVQRAIGTGAHYIRGCGGAWSLRHAAETEPIPALRSVTVCALALAEGLCWDSLNLGDTAAFTREAAVCAELHEFGVCAGLLKDA